MSSWTPLIATHAAAASTGLLLGGYQLARRVKGDRPHVVLGWVWIAAMTYVGTSSFAIRELRNGRLSLLHVLSIVTLISLVIGIVGIRRGNLGRHKAAMRGSWFGLVGAFIGAVSAPNRRIPTFAVDHPAGLVLAGLTVVALTVALIVLAHGLDRAGRAGRFGRTAAPASAGASLPGRRTTPTPTASDA
jgi:uncharacterized membrane protein